MALPTFVTRVLDLVFTRFVTDLLGTDPIQHSIAWRELAQRRGGTCNEPGGRANAVTPPDSVDIRTRHAEVRVGEAADIPVGPGDVINYENGDHVTPWLEALDGVLLLSEAGTLHLRWLGIPTKHALLAGVAVLEELAAGRHRVGAFR